MPKVISSTELQKQTREAIDYARVERDAIIVETYGRPMAVILSYEEYKAYMAYREAEEQREARFAFLRESAEKNAAYSGLSEDEAMNIVEEIREEIAAETRSKG